MAAWVSPPGISPGTTGAPALRANSRAATFEPIVAMTLAAGISSATLGVAGLGYSFGLAGAWFFIMLAIGAWLLLFTVAGRLRLLAQYSLVDVFDIRYGPAPRVVIGVLGGLAGIVGSVQAVEVIKQILGIGDTLSGRLLAYDSLEQSFRTYKMLRDPQCPACSIDPDEIVIAEYDELCMPHPIAPPAG